HRRRGPRPPRQRRDERRPRRGLRRGRPRLGRPQRPGHDRPGPLHGARAGHRPRHRLRDRGGRRDVPVGVEHLRPRPPARPGHRLRRPRLPRPRHRPRAGHVHGHHLPHRLDHPAPVRPGARLRPVRRAVRRREVLGRLRPDPVPLAGPLMSRILVVTLDTLAERMAGPAIRAWEIASALAAEHSVRLVTFGACDRPGEGFTTAHTTVGEFRAEVEGADVVVVQGFVVATFPWLQSAEQVLVVDLYDPFHLESLEVERYKPAAERHAALATALRELNAQTRRGDLFLCASEKQRDLWLGQLAAAGRINPDTYDADPSLRSLITVVPFGTSPTPPARTAPAIKGVVPGIGPDDKVVLWGGGVYNWFDPVTVVRAVDAVRQRVPEVRLYFLGMKHPNPDVPEMAMATRTRDLADSLGLTGTHVFFNEDWVPYGRRADYLLDADVGVSAHFDHIETAFSFRTRILDYLWADLPIVCTEGDTFGELVAAEGLGAAVAPEDVDG